MARTISPSEIPEEVARFAEAQVAAGRFASIADVLLAGKEALEEREASMDEADADAHPHDWADYLRYRFDEGRKVIARGEYYDGSPAELVARIRERVESKPR